MKLSMNLFFNLQSGRYIKRIFLIYVQNPLAAIIALGSGNRPRKLT